MKMREKNKNASPPLLALQSYLIPLPPLTKPYNQPQPINQAALIPEARVSQLYVDGGSLTHIVHGILNHDVPVLHQVQVVDTFCRQ